VEQHRKFCKKGWMAMRNAANWRAPIRDRIDAEILVVPSGCHIWCGSSTLGYGQIKYKGRTVRVHRLIYRLHHKLRKLPKGLQIDHLCCNKLCVNPRHLELVTPKQNLTRAANQISTINSKKTHCLRGHPLTKENTRRNGSGSRVCIECGRLHGRISAKKWRERNPRGRDRWPR
jgi:hypothetical protein